MSTTDILTKLPEVFDLRDLQIATDIERKHASQMCWRWTKKGYIKAFAEGVFFNLIADRKAESNFIAAAINKVVPSFKIVIGVNALNAGGWTTQMPRIIELAIAVDRNHKSFRQMEGVTIAPRSVEWFRKMLPVCKSRGVADQLILPPAYALVDSFMDKVSPRTPKGMKAIWHPAADDISIDDPEQAINDILQAAETLDAPLEELMEYLSEISDLEDVLPSAQSFKL